jgi:hypothetical protein
VNGLINQFTDHRDDQALWSFVDLAQAGEVHRDHHRVDHRPDQRGDHQVDRRVLPARDDLERPRELAAERDANHDAQGNPNGKITIEDRHGVQARVAPR